MKNQLILLLALCLSACQTAPTKTTALADQSTDQQAVLAEIENETKDFYKKDHAAWSTHYAHSPKVHWACVEPDVTLRASGWEDLSKFVADWMKANPDPIDYEKAQFKNENVQVSIVGDMAFVSMNASNIQPDSTLRKTISSRTLVKEEGKWKIISMTSYPSDTPTNGSSANIYVHKAS